jgi:lipoprotein-anchoring transpeptidase ErfK/SrfK
VFKERKQTGEVLPPNAPGRDPIVTRILWLRGLESQNINSFQRCIYIHGTTEEKFLGKPVSWGCIRMKSKDVVKVFESVDIGTKVEILQKPLKLALKEHATGLKRRAMNVSAD